ncbi:hydantoinase B/oxoprolinase family protein [Rhizobium leguminosarum]|uniref:hydantoinase B/oxoprolinase family protein n=1 Tax=Rhizobium leguminosarum TaxID=384 RepID=UPI001C96E0BF|nr:hydantoinase B/oxoprolinase family protein [Rhizobium leguminosarum]MBY5619063.1 hydantoinase B/oxoprolinase family protein [Rhizobium leguminosarum]MBY5666877.1 hydantoinase B/oxoprolinase family protein [Rhizobium leguminosarum]MBY5679936.1 hydantoinase B/oxoprolinase family protein [Rhizobium leguminosarum]
MSKIDPITVEVIGSALTSIVEEMGEALVRASYSTNIKERRDCSTALFDRHGNILCQAEHIPMHLGSFIGIIPHINKRFAADDIKPGDVFMGNDAYEGGATHLPDIVLAEPIFHAETMVGWAINTAHHADFADRGHAHIYQEGLRIPPVRLYRQGQLQKDLQDMFLLNCQVPHERLSDLRAQMSANRLCVQRMQDLCTKYGADLVLAAGDALQDYAERKMRAGIAAIPDGVYSFTDYFDSNQFSDIMELKVEITINGDAMHIAFDAPPQVPAGLNVIYTALLATCYYAVKAVIDPTILPNAGLSRPISVEAPHGSLLNCKHPAAVDGRIAACQRVADLVQGALAKALPGRVTAAGNGACTGALFTGTREDGSLWVYLETVGGGGGARPTADGLSGVHVHMTNTSNLPVEALELEYPLTLLRYELVNGSAGAGTWRGGMGLRRVYRIEADCRFSVEGGRLLVYPWGLEGGLQATGSHFDFGNGQQNLPGTVQLKAGQVVELVTPGGGGYGSPSGRSLEAIRRDIKEERITAEFAERVYRRGAEQKPLRSATA